MGFLLYHEVLSFKKLVSFFRSQESKVSLIGAAVLFLSGLATAFLVFFCQQGNSSAVWILQGASYGRNSDPANSCSKHITAAWIFDQPMPQIVLNNLDKLSSGKKHVDVLCGSRACMEQVNQSLKSSKTAGFNYFNP